MFTTALFIISRTWKQHRCPSKDKWIQKLQYIYTMEYYSAIKSTHLMRWMNLKPIIQNEVSQKEKNKCHVLTHIIQSDSTDKAIHRQRRHRRREQKCGHNRDGEGGTN